MGDTLSGLLVMPDGTAVRGVGGGAPGLAVGELVFQTGMVGYQEALTDPSYAGQVLIFTYPLVGNYGVGDLSNQSARVHPKAVVAHQLVRGSGHRATTHDLDQMLRDQGIPALYGVDTRLLTRRVRTHGVIPAAVAVGPGAELPGVEELRLLAAALDYDHTDFVAECTTPEVVWYPPATENAPRVALVDYGSKRAILDHLRQMGAGVWLVPASMNAGEIMALRPDGVLLSNGPGDPARLDYAVQTVRSLLQSTEVPIFGICLGHQLLALAAGGRTSKMRFGHRGINQPVLELATGRVSITTQNHGYMVDPDTIPAGYVVTHTNLNDGSVEGIAHATMPVWGVQWHPEAHPGPSDTKQLFANFLGSMEVARA